MTKPTAGPWRLWHQGGTIAVYGKNQPFGEHPCVVTWGGFDGCDLPLAKQLANARLITAAPELLESLQWAISFIEAGETDTATEKRIDKAMIAIGKVYGLEPQSGPHK